MASYATLPRNDTVGIAARLFEQISNKLSIKNFQVRFWDGTCWGAVRPRFTLILKNPWSLRKLFLSPSELSVGESFIYDDFDVEGDLEAAFEFADYLFSEELPLTAKLQLRVMAAIPRGWIKGRGAAALKGGQHSTARDRAAVRYHYDVSNDFFKLFLDRRMVYSCAYFRSPDDDLDTAQRQKLDYLCRKLRLKPGDRLLELGCGWGGLLIHAAQEYGVNAFGITLSIPQAELARERIQQAGVASRCRVEVCDYREIDAEQQFDKLVSVGMFEHVGEALLPEYFSRAWRLLRPGGVFLNHGIAASATFKPSGESFIEKYVFPDGELVPINTTIRAAENCGFEVEDVENLRRHYEMTLRHWSDRLQAHAEEARRMTDDATFRTWRIYMAGSAHGFRVGRMNLCQLLLNKSERGRSELPLTREDWYADRDASEA
jgi:cyclopropane-fatty-acyl-phospholipid synthase